MWVEIFRTGRHTDSTGRTADYGTDDLDSIAGMYNAKAGESEAYEAPVVKGHPKTNDPAYGWVEKLKRQGNILKAKLKDLAPGFSEEIKKGRYRKISIALFPDMLLRHVGFLGAASPAVQGLQPVTFSDDDYVELNFEYSDTDNKPFYKFFYRDKEDHGQNQLEKENDALKKELASLKKKLFDREKDAKEREFTEFLEELCSSPGGPRLTPLQQDTAASILMRAHRADMLLSEKGEFSGEESTTEMIMDFIAGMDITLPEGEFASADSVSLNDSSDDFAGKKVSEDRLDIHNKANELLKRSPGLTYEEAVLRVM